MLGWEKQIFLYQDKTFTFMSTTNKYKNFLLQLGNANLYAIFKSFIYICYLNIHMYNVHIKPILFFTFSLKECLKKHMFKHMFITSLAQVSISCNLDAYVFSVNFRNFIFLFATFHKKIKS